MLRPKRPQKAKTLTYEEVAQQIGESSKITVRYDGLERTGYWYEDHMMKMFSACKLIRIGGPIFQVEEWPKKGA